MRRWEKLTDWPLMAAAAAFLAAYALQVVAPRSHALVAGAEVVLWVTWAMFAVDYLARLWLAEQRWKWFLRHLLDLAVVALPMLRPLRLMRFLTAITLIQRSAGGALRGRVALYTIGATTLTILVSGLAVLDAERGSAGPIQSYAEALWWSFVTITTVGYGDYTPVTATGRVVAAVLMIGGISLIGVVTATLASWIVEKVSDETSSAAGATAQQVELLRTELAELRSLLRAAIPVRADPSASGAPPTTDRLP